MSFHAYLLRCVDGRYFTGHTDQLDVRMGRHATGPACALTKHRRPVVLA